MEIRLANKEDVKHIKVILDRNFDEIMTEHHSRPIIEKFKSHNSHESLLNQLNWKKVYVVVDVGEVVATGAFVNFGSQDKPKYSVSNLYVQLEKHSMGIGRMIFEKLYEEAIIHKASSFHVPSSRNAIGFYEKMGFVIDNEQHEAEDEITWMTMLL